MFGFGKTKMTLNDFVEQNWEKITNPDRLDLLKTFLSESGDADLKNVDFEIFSNCMLAAYVQVLRIAVMQTQSTDATLYFGLEIGKKLETNTHANSYWIKLNKSFGSSTDGFKAMSASFGNLMKPSTLSSNGTEIIYQQLLEAFFGMKETLKSIKIVP
jgi:hypothetical protein